jgi:iron complex outermembrane receptor protein
MTQFRTRPALRLALLPAGVALALAPLLAAAQDAPPQDATTTLDRIEVTGSNIPRTSTETASPVQVISRQDIDRTGKATVAEYLQTLTADGAGSIPKTFGNGFAGGGAGISLRALGAASTLVLLNGRRMAPYGLADDGQKVFTDLSTIPMEAVERIEVLKDGASSIYGSDAIAGVVNIILRKDFTGVTVKGSYGISGDSDIAQRKGTIAAGWGDLATDGYNFFFNIDASKTDGILASDRRNRKWIGSGDLRPYGYDVPGSAFLAGSITGGGTVANGSPVGAVGVPDGNGVYHYTSLPGCAQFPAVGAPDPGGGCLYDVARFRNLVPDEKYLNFFSRGTFAINDNAELYSEFSYSTKETVFVNGFSGVSGAWGYPGGPVNASGGPGATVLGPNHPDNPTGQAARLRYAAFDVGPRVTTNKNEFERFLVGLKGTAGAWDYDVGYLHSGTSLHNSRTGYLRYSHVRTALSDPNSPVGYWRIGDDAGLNSQALYDYISPTINAVASSKLDIVDAKLSRSLTDLPGGALGIAFGAEYRRQSVELTPQSYTDIGDIIGLGYSAYKGTEKVAAAYVEVLAPVLSTLELTGALRLDSYQGGENSTTPKFGIKWTPADWIALRATYAEGFRAPNPAEAGVGGLAAFSTAEDPVRCPNGVPVPGGNATNADCAAPLAIITTPNPNLKPETSKSYTVGLVLEPTPNTSLTLDAYQITRKDEIAPGNTDQAIAAGHVVRNDNDLPGIPNSGTLLAANVDYVNAAQTRVRGFDFDARQRFDLGDAGKLSLDLQWTRINSLAKTEAGATVEYAGTHGNCDVTNCIGTPKDRVNFGATWDLGAFSLSSVVNWRSSFKNIKSQGEACANHLATLPDGSQGANAPSGCEIRSFYTIDLSARWKPSDAWEVFGSVANVTDRIAPLDPLTYGAIYYNPMDSSGAIGRYYTVGFKYGFH